MLCFGGGRDDAILGLHDVLGRKIIIRSLRPRARGRHLYA